MKTITIKGTGRISARPDTVELLMNLEAKAMNYAEAVDQASRRIQMIQRAAAQAGHDVRNIKTESFRVDTDYRSVKDLNDDYTRVFDGYICFYALRLNFDFDAERLSRTIQVIAASGADPEISVRFTVKEPEKFEEVLLSNMAKDARKRAEITCAAAGARLGGLVSVDYNWRDHEYFSQTRYDCEPRMLAAERCAAPPPVEPDDIPVQDSAVFVWEIL